MRAKNVFKRCEDEDGQSFHFQLKHLEEFGCYTYQVSHDYFRLFEINGKAESVVK